MKLSNAHAQSYIEEGLRDESLLLVALVSVVTQRFSSVFRDEPQGAMFFFLTSIYAACGSRSDTQRDQTETQRINSNIACVVKLGRGVVVCGCRKLRAGKRLGMILGGEVLPLIAHTGTCRRVWRLYLSVLNRV